MSDSLADGFQGLMHSQQVLVEKFLRDLPAQGLDPAALLSAINAGNPATASVSELQSAYYRDWLRLWTSTESQSEEDGDPRFAGDEWRQLPWFRFLRSLHSLNSRYLSQLAEAADLPRHQKQRLHFMMRQLADAIAPTNFAVTNPEAIKAAIRSGGASLAQGMQQLAGDLAKGRISMTDESAFEVGRDLAVTPGDVILENEVMQLIQYRPATRQVLERPLLLVPPFINKYYILDLRPENSFARYCVERGFTTFMISWRNVPPELGHLSWDDYIGKGVFAAIDAALEVTAAATLNVLGFCVGGTLLASALAVQAAKRRESVASLTLLASMLDFSDVGEIAAYIDEGYVAQCERDFEDGGIMPGARLATTFASLRARELIWHFVVSNYLLGRPPKAFDLLYWNADSCNVPGVLYRYYLRNMYLENNLGVPGKLRMHGVGIDLSRIRIPAYVLAASGDHIVPWRTAYRSARLLGGPVEFVLGGSGHVAGVVNPVSSRQRQHWVGGRTTDDPDAWLAAAQRRDGSWWTHWGDWLQQQSGQSIPAPASSGSAKHCPLELAPGRYVHDRS